MGACIDNPKKKTDIQNATPVVSLVTATRIGFQESKDFKEKSKGFIELDQVPKRPKWARMTITELLLKYSIDFTLEQSTKMEGPKYLSNIVDGSSRILRIVDAADIDEQRFRAYEKILGLQVYENEEGDLMVFDEDFCGATIVQLMGQLARTENGEQLAVLKADVLNFVREVYNIIEQFHTARVWLGNLSIFSFKRASTFDSRVRLLEFNWNRAIEPAQTGFAHVNGFQADWQFFGFFLQFILKNDPPIFLPHKLQYSDSKNYPHASVVLSLLKGNKCSVADIDSIQKDEVLMQSMVGVGYTFRRDLNRLLKMRRKRKPHNRRLYGKDVNGLGGTRIPQETLYRYQTERIYSKIEQYLGEVNSRHEESCIFYSNHGEKFRRLKEVFLKEKTSEKLVELRECMESLK